MMYPKPLRVLAGELGLSGRGATGLAGKTFFGIPRSARDPNPFPNPAARGTKKPVPEMLDPSFLTAQKKMAGSHVSREASGHSSLFD